MPKAEGLVSALVNVNSSIGLVIINKWLFSFEKWHFGASLIVIHVAVTYAICEALACFRVFERKYLARRSVVQLASVAVLSTVFMNLSLLYNSIGTYQLSKLMIIPCTVILQFSVWSVRQSRSILLSLVLVVTGVGLATVHELHTNTRGLICLVAAVLSSTINQIWMETLQKQLECSPIQLIHQFTPWALLLSVVVVPVIEDIDPRSLQSIWLFPYRSSAIILIGLSSLFAGALNISGYFVVGHFSALTYQVIGHLKTLTILLFGVILFSDPIGGFQSLGVALSVLGMCAYAYCKVK